MKISDFDYELPEERIVLYPPEVRGQSRLLVLDRRSGAIEHRGYQDMADYVQPGDVIVLNDTKVIKARLLATDPDGKQRELLLIEEHGEKLPHTTRKCLYRGRVHEGETLHVGNAAITITRILSGGIAEVESDHDLLTLAEQTGSVPLPPYLHRDATPGDTERYQTVFADKPGSVAAPTASLNFTQDLRDKLTTKGAKTVYLTLHVGLGTFLPIRTDDVESHHMHSEYFEVPKATVEAIQHAKQTGKHVWAVGTTVTRTLEYAASNILDHPPRNLSGEADIFMYPGYQFRVVDKLLTNFHAPRTTVLMLAAAFATWPHLHHAYDEAVAREYSFLSYGDSMLIV